MSVALFCRLLPAGRRAFFRGGGLLGSADGVLAPLLTVVDFFRLTPCLETRRPPLPPLWRATATVRAFHRLLPTLGVETMELERAATLKLESEILRGTGRAFCRPPDLFVTGVWRRLAALLPAAIFGPQSANNSKKL